MEVENKNLFKYIVRGAIVVFGLILILTALDIVPTGSTQVVTRFGRVTRTNGEGIAIHIPFVERTKSIDTTIRRESAKADAATSNLQQVTADVAVNYRITRENAVKQYQNFTKKDFVSIIVAPKIQDSVKAITPNYTPESLVLQRSKVAGDIKALLTKALGEYGIDVVDVSIANYSFSKDYTDAIASKSVVQQQIETAKLTATKNEQEGNANIIAAQKAAEARRLQTSTASMTPEDLNYYKLQIQSKMVDKWDGKLPTTQTGDSTILSLPVNN